MDKVEEIIRRNHNNDSEQLEFIFSKDKRVVVQAPAGCGKTRSMISKIAYEFGTNRIANHKKILALTFSVNAATKIKDDVKNILPELLGENINQYINRVDVANYHKFALSLIRKYGYSINEKLIHIDEFEILSEWNTDILTKYLTEKEISSIQVFQESISKCRYDEIKQHVSEYYAIMNNLLINNNIITFNGVLLCAIKLLQNPHIRKFYSRYYEVIIVDEFQDTNYIAYRLITGLIGENRVYIMGDELQKIYSFMGAIPGLFKAISESGSVHSIEFKTNYRFKDNQQLKELDCYIRHLDKSYNDIQSFNKSAEINVKISNTAKSEAEYIVNHILNTIKGTSENVAILFRSKYGYEDIVNVLENNKVEYFNGLFNDTDKEYVIFHKKAYEIYLDEYNKSKTVNKVVLERVASKIEKMSSDIILDSSNKKYIINSLNELLRVFFISIKKSRISQVEKHQKVCFVLGNGSLKTMISEVDEKIIITTIHSAKGLEWDYVYIPYITAFGFPASRQLCNECKSKSGRKVFSNCCEFKFITSLEKKFREELSVFYVALTRAKKDVYFFTNTDKNSFGHNKKASCFLVLPNLTYNYLE